MHLLGRCVVIEVVVLLFQVRRFDLRLIFLGNCHPLHLGGAYLRTSQEIFPIQDFDYSLGITYFGLLFHECNVVGEESQPRVMPIAFLPHGSFSYGDY